MRKPCLWLTIILNKHLDTNTFYLTIKYSKTIGVGTRGLGGLQPHQKNLQLIIDRLILGVVSAHLHY